MKFTLVLLAAALTSCASVVPCDLPAASIVDGQYLVFDYENAVKLSKMVQDVADGKCKITDAPKKPAQRSSTERGV